jgi:hypothetical protein
MKISLLLLGLLLSNLALAEQVLEEKSCWEIKLDEDSIKKLNIKPEKLTKKAGVSYTSICIDFKGADKNIKYAGGGGCGGSSRCGSNFLILDDLILELGNPIPDLKDANHWKIFTENSDVGTSINIAKDLESAKRFIKKSHIGEQTIMSNNLIISTNSLLKQEIGKAKLKNIDLLKQFKNENINNFNGLQVNINKLAGPDGLILRINKKL